MTDPIRILVADDHLIIRQGLRLILETEPDLLLVGEASDGAEAIDLVDKFHPDVVLMDLRMPGMDGLTALQRLRVTHPNVAVVILTTFNEDGLMRKGLGLGARGYLLKDTDRGSLFNTIRAAARGETLLKPEVLEKLLENKKLETKSAESEYDIDLTDREIEVLVSVAKGERSKEIAYTLGITERTVKAHLSNIYSKLGVDSRAAAVSEAMRRGWLPNR
jgi:NarL family two-component system response regulator YdfI